jgi:hypothetical protein
MTCQTLPNIVQASSYMKPEFRTRKQLKKLHDHLDKQPSKKPVWVSVCHPRSSLDFYYQDLPCTEDITRSSNFIPSPAIMRSEGFPLLQFPSSAASSCFTLQLRRQMTPYISPSLISNRDSWTLGQQQKQTPNDRQATSELFSTSTQGLEAATPASWTTLALRQKTLQEEFTRCGILSGRWIWIGRMTSRNFIGHS